MGQLSIKYYYNNTGFSVEVPRFLTIKILVIVNRWQTEHNVTVIILIISVEVATENIFFACFFLNIEEKIHV